MQNGTLEASSELADDMLVELKRVGRLRSPRVEQAGFAVLKSPDIPSVLVETAFISNPKDERQLRSKKFQNSIAMGLLRGIKHYLQDNATPRHIDGRSRSHYSFDPLGRNTLDHRATL